MNNKNDIYINLTFINSNGHGIITKQQKKTRIVYTGCLLFPKKILRNYTYVYVI